MTVTDTRLIWTHGDPAFFREALIATSAATGFGARMIEKDYFCSVVLEHLAAAGTTLVFKGGTCLAKVHSSFYRLSEDLDFTIPVTASSRSQRSREVRPLNELLRRLEARGVGLSERSSLTGANNSTQYVAVLAYRSVILDAEETIKLEVGLREALLRPSVHAPVRTLLTDPVSGQAIVPVFGVRCLSVEETMAEKVRAALCRRTAAIRDFFDIDHAVGRGSLQTDDRVFLDLVSRKLAVPGNDPPDTSPARLRALRPQVDVDLAPVVRQAELERFDLDRAFATVAGIAASVERSR